MEWEYQRAAAESCVRYLTGVTGVSNAITIKPRAAPADIKKKIEEALQRSARTDGRRITVVVEGRTVILRGHVRSAAESTGLGGSPADSITKLVLSELSQQITELGFELAGAPAAYWDEAAGEPIPAETYALLDSRRFTIAGGTSEVQRNIVGERVLGLDREFDPGRGKPWRELRRS